MVRKPKPVPDPDQPGGFLPNRRRQKAGLNRGILASCWGLLATRTEQKAAASGAVVISVDPRHSSQQCRVCGHGAYAHARRRSTPARREPPRTPHERLRGIPAHQDREDVKRTTISRITGIFTGNRELTGLLSAVDLLGVDTDAAALRAGLKQMFEQPRPATGGYGR